MILVNFSIYIHQNLQKRIQMFLLISIVLVVFSRQSIICNGDFEGYSQYVRPSTTDPYAFISSNTSCWYNQNMLTFEVKKPATPQVSIVCELVSSVPYTLCQNIEVAPSVEYELTFSILNPKGVTSSVVAVSLNGTLLIEARVSSERAVLAFSKNFTSVGASYALCFKPKSYTKTLFNTDLCGPCLDNVTLRSLSPAINNSLNNQNASNLSLETNTTYNHNISNHNQNNSGQTHDYQDLNLDRINLTENQTSHFSHKQKFYIFCTSDVLQLEWRIRYSCQYQIGGQIIQIEAKQNIVIIFQGEIQDNYKFIKIDRQEFIIDVFPDRQYDLSTVSILMQEAQQISHEAEFVISVDGRKILFNILSRNYAETFKTISPITQQFAEKTKQIHQLLRSVFCSFLITNLISFWNLSLMYNFLNIQSIPEFSKVTLEKLAIITYKIDTITEFLKKTFKLDDQAFDFSSTISHQKMKMYRNSYAWFGYMGMSTGAVNNNFESFVLMLFLAVKLGAFYLIRRCCIKTTGRSLLKVSFKVLVLNELLGNVPIYILSAGTDILNVYFLKAKDKANTVLQLMIFLICLAALVLLSLNSANRSPKKRIKIIGKVIEVMIYFTIPICTIFDSLGIFLIVNGVIILYKFLWYIRNRQHFSVRNKIFGVLMNLVWVCHHCIYCIFFIFSYIRKSRVLSDLEKDVLVFCGIVSIFTILCGGIIEAIDFILNIFLLISKKFKKLCKKKKIPDKNSKDKNQSTLVQNQKGVQVTPKINKNISNISNISSLNENKIRINVKVKKNVMEKIIKQCKGSKFGTNNCLKIYNSTNIRKYSIKCPQKNQKSQDGDEKQTKIQKFKYYSHK